MPNVRGRFIDDRTCIQRSLNKLEAVSLSKLVIKNCVLQLSQFRPVRKFKVFKDGCVRVSLRVAVPPNPAREFKESLRYAQLPRSQKSPPQSSRGEVYFASRRVFNSDIKGKRVPLGRCTPRSSSMESSDSSHCCSQAFH